MDNLTKLVSNKTTQLGNVLTKVNWDRAVYTHAFAHNPWDESSPANQ